MKLGLLLQKTIRYAATLNIHLKPVLISAINEDRVIVEKRKTATLTLDNGFLLLNN